MKRFKYKTTMRSLRSITCRLADLAVPSFTAKIDGTKR